MILYSEKTRKWTTWTPGEIEALRSHYPRMGARALAQSGLLGEHTEYSIRQLAYELGIRYANKSGPRPGAGRPRRVDTQPPTPVPACFMPGCARAVTDVFRGRGACEEHASEFNRQVVLAAFKREPWLGDDED